MRIPTAIIFAGLMLIAGLLTAGEQTDPAQEQPVIEGKAATPAADAAKARTAGEVYPEFGVGFLEDAALADIGPDVLATVNGKAITRKYLEQKIKDTPEENRALFESTRGFVLAQLVQRELMLTEARKQNLVKEGADEKAENQGIRDMVDKQVEGVEVTDDELKQAFQEHKEELGDAKFEDIKEQMREMLLQRKKQEKFIEFMEGIGKGAKIVVDDKWAAEQQKIITDNPVDKARASGKPTMVEFFAEWCPPCKKMKPTIDELRKDRKDVNIVSIDVDQNEALPLRYGIQNLPTQVYFDRNGKEVDRHEGYVEKGALEAKLDKLAKQDEPAGKE
ncbi:MAG TPA: thioredoxin domain-containing protein [Planctomycetota bacterium]|nr:thioredoxin domain-containing protein [Planctomycetota bacterium]